MIYLAVTTDEKDRIIEAQAQRIAQLGAEVAELKRVVAELTERLNKNSQNSPKPPSTDPVWKKPKHTFSPGEARPGPPRRGSPSTGAGRSARP